MKITQDAINILKNFSIISNSIIIEPGNTIATVAADNSVFASATVADEFTRQFAVYNLPEFISILTLLKEPHLQFVSDKHVLIKSDNVSVSYMFAEPSLIKKAPKNIKEQEVIAKFELDAKRLDRLIRAMSVMSLQYVLFEGDGEKIYISGVNINGNSKSNNYKEEIGQTDKTFRKYIELINIKIIDGNYNVEVTDRWIRFTSLDKNLVYNIALKAIT